MATMSIPAVDVSSHDAGGSRRPSIPVVGMGTAAYPFGQEAVKPAILHAIELGYRHFDTAALYQSEEALGEAVDEALRRGLIASRSELFVTSKLWCNNCHPDLVLPAIRNSLRNLRMEYLDLYLIHWPMSLKREAAPFPVRSKDVLPLELRSVWEAMEDCKRLGLTKSIGVSNFPTKKLEELLQYAKIPPAVNQVEMNPAWQQKRLRDFCKEKGIHVTAYSPIGGQVVPMSNNPVRDCQVLKEIAEEKGKTVAQVSLRWVYEQGVSMVVKSFNKGRLKENIEIFNWELSDDDLHKISQIPQCKRVSIRSLLSVSSDEQSIGSFDLSDVDVVD